MTRAAERGELQPEIDTLRALIREAHETLRDLRTERRAVEQLLAGIEARVQRAVGSLIETQVTEQVAALGEATDKAMRESVAKVGREFDRLAGIYLGHDDDRGTLEELARNAITRRAGT